MLHILREPFEFAGLLLKEIRLSDYVKAKHNLAYAKVAKLSRDLGLPDIRKDYKLDELSEEDMLKVLCFEADSQQILLESFAEGFPKEALPELSAADCQAISRHIAIVMEEHQRKYGKPEAKQASKKKKTRIARSAS